MRNDIYQAYRENSLIGGSPTELIVALYDGAIEATRNAAQCLENGDIWGRSKAITKATNILTELIISLDTEKGGDVAANLKRLYAYMQSRLLDAHVKKSKQPLTEVEGLLTTLLSAWRVVAEKAASTTQPSATTEHYTFESQGSDATQAETEASGMSWGSYLWDVPETLARVAYTF
jgi:flagellar protein FliS